MSRRIKRVQATGVAHARAQRQGFATGTGTKVSHHFAALGVHQQRQQLRALVLHFNMALLEQSQFAQVGFGRHAQTPG